MFQFIPRHSCHTSGFLCVWSGHLWEKNLLLTEKQASVTLILLGLSLSKTWPYYQSVHYPLPSLYFHVFVFCLMRSDRWKTCEGKSTNALPNYHKGMYSYFAVPKTPGCCMRQFCHDRMLFFNNSQPHGTTTFCSLYTLPLLGWVGLKVDCTICEKPWSSFKVCMTWLLHCDNIKRKKKLYKAVICRKLSVNNIKPSTKLKTLFHILND